MRISRIYLAVVVSYDNIGLFYYMAFFHITIEIKKKLPGRANARKKNGGINHGSIIKKFIFKYLYHAVHAFIK